MRARPLGAVTSPYLGIVCVISAAAAVGYVGLLGQQGSLPGIDPRMWLVIALLTGSAIASGIGAVTHSADRRAVIAAALAAGLLSLGFLALFSIGLVLMVAGVFALVAWAGAVRDSTAPQVNLWSAAAAIATLVLLALGLIATG
jgi:hypothetical protein